MDRDVLLEYIGTLESSELILLFEEVDLFVRDCADTLSEEFQLAAGLLDVFHNRAAEWHKRREVMPHDSRESEDDFGDPGRDKNLNVGQWTAPGGSAVEGKYGRIRADKKNFHPDEPVFLFRATDRLAPAAIIQYAIACREAGCSPEHVKACLEHAKRVQEWQRDHPELVKLPD